VPLEELEAVLETSSTAPLVNQPLLPAAVDSLGPSHGVRRWPSTVNISPRARPAQELRTGSCVGAGEHQPRHPAAAEVILSQHAAAHRSAGDDPPTRCRTACCAAACRQPCGCCDRPPVCPLLSPDPAPRIGPLMRLPRVHCARATGAATSYLLT